MKKKVDFDDDLKESKAVKYAEYCINETEGKVPRAVKRQCILWLSIVYGEEDGVYVCPKQYRKICKLLKLMQSPDVIGKSIYETMDDYAWLLIVAALCTLRADGTTYYTTVLLAIARKNRKTFYAAVIFLLKMLTGVFQGRYFSVAPNLELSQELQIALDKILAVSPALYCFKRLRKEIRCSITKSNYKPLACTNDRLDGRQANLFLVDEAGQMDSKPLNSMRTSQRGLTDKQGIIISSLYSMADSCLLSEIDKAKSFMQGLSSRVYFALLYIPDDEIQKDWATDMNVIYQSNPIIEYNPQIMEATLDDRSDAILFSADRENFLCKDCNIFYRSAGAEEYIDLTKLKQCAVPEDPREWEGRTVYVGLDLSQTEDNTAVAMVAVHGEEIHAKVWCFVPTNRVPLKSKKENVDYNAAIARGECFPCGDEAISYGFVEDFIMHLQERYKVKIKNIAYDPYNARSTVDKLEREGYQCVELKQHSSVLHPATKLLKEAVLHGDFSYDMNKLLEVNFGNAKCSEDTNLNKYVSKKKSSGKVDMVVALINALQMAITDMRKGSFEHYIIRG